MCLLDFRKYLLASEFLTLNEFFPSEITQKFSSSQKITGITLIFDKSIKQILCICSVVEKVLFKNLNLSFFMLKVFKNLF